MDKKHNIASLGVLSKRKGHNNNHEKSEDDPVANKTPAPVVSVNTINSNSP